MSMYKCTHRQDRQADKCNNQMRKDGVKVQCQRQRQGKIIKDEQ